MLMHSMKIYYKDGEYYTLYEGSQGIACQDAKGISEHESVDRVELWLETDMTFEKYYFLDGYAMPR